MGHDLTAAAAAPHPMKLFSLPEGLRVWNGPNSEGDTRFLYRENFERRCYEQHGVTVKDGDVIFDVGANIGMFSLSLMSRFRDLRIFCFEPVPGTFACLARNVDDSPVRSSHSVQALNVGLGTADAQIEIEFFPGAPSNSTLYSPEKHRDFARVLDGVSLADMWRTNKARALLIAPLFPFRRRLLRPMFERVMAEGVSIPCRIRTLSGVIVEHELERIDLLKVDVEGAEFDVLEGIDEKHWPLIRQVSMEVEPANKARIPELTSQLERRGFTRVTVQNMFGGPCKLDDPVACTVFALRSLQ